jgi:hypothetical protein
MSVFTESDSRFRLRFSAGDDTRRSGPNVDLASVPQSRGSILWQLCRQNGSDRQTGAGPPRRTSNAVLPGLVSTIVHSTPQYLRVKAVALLESPEPNVRASGRGLLDRLIAEYADRAPMEACFAHELLGNAYRREG